MRTKLVVSLAAVTLAALAAYAQTPLRAAIPFNFVVAGQTLKAGTYRLSEYAQPGVIELTNQDTGQALVFLTAPGATAQTSGSPHLLFKRYGRMNFLSRIDPADGTAELKLRMSPAEREMAQNAAPQQVAIAGMH